MTDHTNRLKEGSIANGDTQELDLVGTLGGSRTSNTLYAWGDWYGGTLAIQVSPDGTNWFPYADTLTDDNFFVFSARFVKCRIAVTGGDQGGTTAINFNAL